MPDIILSTLNARYVHASLGLRYLQSNLGFYRPKSEILEFTINQRSDIIIEEILQRQPKIIGFGVYIWNTEQTRQVIAQLKVIQPEIKIILGGPEVSYESDLQEIVSLADYVISGAAETEFSRLCEKLLNGEATNERFIRAAPQDLDMLEPPYELYNESDIKNRVLYVEASRGCPFKCEFCLSALDKTAWPFDLERFLSEMDKLIQRGARQFKFVDRTFNLKVDNSLRILQFFLEKLKDTELFLHFELIPDRLPLALRDILPQFPPGCLQFEIGVQSFNDDVQERISRRQDNEKTCTNIHWIGENTHAHIHADLIFALPGESLESFGKGFDKLYTLGTHEIQLGILKRLRGTPITRHTQDFDMRYNPLPPYNILSNKDISFEVMQKINRFARYWDLVANSGRFKKTTQLMLQDSPFDSFYKIAESIYQQCGQTHKIALKNLYGFLYIGMTETLGLEHDIVRKAIEDDFNSSSIKDQFKIPQIKTIPTENNKIKPTPKRQHRHLN